MGFHVDGFARDLVNMPARLVVPIPAGSASVTAPARRRLRHRAAHAVRHAKLEPGETILVQAGGSGIGSTAIKMAKAIGSTVITTSATTPRRKRPRRSRDHVINYQDRAVRNRGTQVTARRVSTSPSTCRPDTSTLAALPQARRRLVTCARPRQSITMNCSALFAAIPHLRLVRLLDAQHPRKPPKMHPGFCRDRHEVPLADFERGSLGSKPAGVRQDHRYVLMPSGASRSCSILRPRSDRCAARRIKHTDRKRMANFAGALLRKAARCSRNIARPRAIARRIPGKIDAEIEKIWRRVGQSRPIAIEFAHLDEFCVEALRAGRRHHLPAGIEERYDALCGRAKRPSASPPPRNWELPGIGAKLIGVKSACCTAAEYRRHRRTSSSSCASRYGN